MSSDWTQPTAVDGLQTAFDGDMAALLPAWEEIPEEFKSWHNPWGRVVSDWFFDGLRDAKWKPKQGVSEPMALRHLASILRSWEPKHEHKEAGVAYLMSLWFVEPPTYTKGRAS